MFTSILFFIIVLSSSSFVQCDITNVNEFFNLVKQNSSITHRIGFLSAANYDVVKRYLTGNVKDVYFTNKTQMLEAIDNETIVGMLNRIIT
jgi:RNase adaptor protein for sRNA GlmZ degradation